VPGRRLPALAAPATARQAQRKLSRGPCRSPARPLFAAADRHGGIFRRAAALTSGGMKSATTANLGRTAGPTGGRGAAARRPGGRRGLGLVAGVAVLAAAAVAFALEAAGVRPVPPASPRTVARPAVERVTAAGLHGVVRAAAGRVVLVNVWATWCDPCRQEFPDLLRLRRALAGRGLDLVLVSADFDSRLPRVRSFLAAQGVDFTTYLKDESDTAFIDGLDPAWSGSLPATLVYDRSGALRDFWEGPATYETLLGKVSKLLGP
jgi:thiol-disulfide isomerase/thioredoxin